MTRAKERRLMAVDLTAVETGKARAQAKICIAAELVCIAVAAISFIAGAALPVLPVLRNGLSPYITWISMGLEALAFAMGGLARWIDRNAFGGGAE